MKQVTILSILSLLILGCLSTARISDFSDTAANIDFDSLSREYKQSKTSSWTLETSDEYYFEKGYSFEEIKLLEAIKFAFAKNNYSVDFSKGENKCVIGRRGLGANEWGAITAVYYKIQSNKSQVYVKTKISQDVVGGWQENRAMKVGKMIEIYLVRQNH